MKIESAHWTPKGNILLIRCQCGHLLEHPANRRTVVCPQCQRVEDCLQLKDINK